MTPPAPGDRWANLIGALLMVASMAAFAVEELFIKAAPASLPIAQILVLFGLGGALLLASFARLRGEPLFTPGLLARPMLVRVVFEITGRLFHVLAIALSPLSTATVILQATPLVVVAGTLFALWEGAAFVLSTRGAALSLAFAVLAAAPAVRRALLESVSTDEIGSMALLLRHIGVYCRYCSSGGGEWTANHRLRRAVRRRC